MRSEQGMAAVANSSHQEVFEQRLLSDLVSKGALSAESADRARRAHLRTGGSLVDILIRLGLCEEKILALTVANAADLKYLDSEEVSHSAVLDARLSIPFLREARAFPLAEDDSGVVVAAADPTNGHTAQAFELLFSKPVRFVVGPASAIDDAIVRHYSEQGAIGGDLQSTAAVDVTDMDIARLRESASEAPIIRFVERLIARAVDAGASDIHIEPWERQLQVRSRIDGMLIEEDPAPLSSASAIVSRIKILARLDIAERRLPQDGSIKMNVRGREIDLRVATAPVVFGESVTIRILDQAAVRLNLDDLGFSDSVLAHLARLLERPNGLILVTGPTGSGKSTTLYASLDKLNDSRRKIITIEDPVEFKIEGLNQIQAKPEIGLDFARALRSMLRHDPDVIMVGEIRDAETARIATQAALTGHLVLSTLHTNDAASAVARLLDMGVEDYLIASTLTGVIAQRLVRVLCKSCRKPVHAPAAMKATAQGQLVYEAHGCADCRGTGYRGRSVIAEMLAMEGAVRRSIFGKPDGAAIKAEAIASGMQPLYENGMENVRLGVTSFEEVLRVAHDLTD
jgi:general secretion pathway protein E